MADVSLAGQRVLLLEDDYFLATDASQVLRGAGADVIGPFPREEPALLAVKQQLPTAALLDINLGRGPSFVIARELRRAQVPFAFVTGYDQVAVPQEFADIPRLEKPVDPDDFVSVIMEITTGRRPAA